MVRWRLLQRAREENRDRLGVKDSDAGWVARNSGSCLPVPKRWVPRPCVFCKGGITNAWTRCFGVCSSRHPVAKRNFAPTDIDPYRSGFAKKVETVAAPPPLFRPLHQSALDRIAMHVPQFLHSLSRAPHVEVVEACLPKGSRPGFVAKEAGLARVFALAPRKQGARRALLENLHDLGRISKVRFGDEQMDMLGHHYISDHDETVALAHLLKDRQETVAVRGSTEKRQTSIAGTGDKVQVMCALGAMQSAGHEHLMVSAASCPPLRKTQGRGTHSFGMGK